MEENVFGMEATLMLLMTHIGEVDGMFVVDEWRALGRREFRSVRETFLFCPRRSRNSGRSDKARGTFRKHPLQLTLFLIRNIPSWLAHIGSCSILPLLSLGECIPQNALIRRYLY